MPLHCSLVAGSIGSCRGSKVHLEAFCNQPADSRCQKEINLCPGGHPSSSREHRRCLPRAQTHHELITVRSCHDMCMVFVPITREHALFTSHSTGMMLVGATHLVMQCLVSEGSLALSSAVADKLIW